MFFVVNVKTCSKKLTYHLKCRSIEAGNYKKQKKEKEMSVHFLKSIS
jgi:hypothetical protein